MDHIIGLGPRTGSTVAIVSPAAGIVVRLDPDTLYLDNCANHTQTFLKKWLMGTYETQIGLHTISNGEQNTAFESGKLLGPLQAWSVRNGVANILSLPELERLGFRIMYGTLDEWVVISPKGGAHIIFKRDTGRCDRFPLCIWMML